MSLHLLAFPSRRGMPNKGGGLVGFGSGLWLCWSRQLPPRPALPSPPPAVEGNKAKTAAIALFCTFRLG
jgi:hypothetical protein